LGTEAARVVVRDGGQPGELYARAGEATYCENGHYLGRFAQDVSSGDVAAPAHLDHLAPGVSVGMTICPQCGGACAVGNPDNHASGTFYFMTSRRPDE